MKSLGYVECNGLSGALVAADRMLKTADIKLEQIQNPKGNGWITLQVSGELSAVTVAVQAVKENLPGIYVTSTVLGSPAPGLGSLGDPFLMKETAKTIKKPATTEADSSVEDEQAEPVEEPTQQSEKDITKKTTCNMCGDPNCPRKVGEPHKKCIHYDEYKNK